MTNAWKRMSSGKYIDLNNLTEGDLDIRDVEVSLNHQYRFTGHHKDRRPLTVAQHSYLCMKLAQSREPKDTELHLACLIHDFAEACVGDVSSPVKKAMGKAWYDFAKPIEELYNLKFFGKAIDPDLHDRVKLYDLTSMDIERRVLWSSQYGKSKWPDVPSDFGGLKNKLKWFNIANDMDYIPLGLYWSKLIGGL